MDLQHYLSIETNNFALNLGEDFYYYQNGKQNTLIHLPTQKEFHDIHNIRNDQPLSIHFNKLINHKPTINIDQFDPNTRIHRYYQNQISIKLGSLVIYQEHILIYIPKTKKYLDIQLYGKILTNPTKTITFPISEPREHISPNFDYIYKNKLYVNNELTIK